MAITIIQQKALFDCVREIRLTLLELKNELCLSHEAYSELKSKIEKLSKCIQKVESQEGSEKIITDTIRNCQDWFGLFAERHNLGEHTSRRFHIHLESLDRIFF